jgi:hypothetical protein
MWFGIDMFNGGSSVLLFWRRRSESEVEISKRRDVIDARRNALSSNNQVDLSFSFLNFMAWPPDTAQMDSPLPLLLFSATAITSPPEP